MMAGTSFSEFLKAGILPLATNTVSYFPGSDRIHLFIFLKMPAKECCLKDHSLCISHSFKYKCCSMNKEAHSTHESQHCTGTVPWGIYGDSVTNSPWILREAVVKF